MVYSLKRLNSEDPNSLANIEAKEGENSKQDSAKEEETNLQQELEMISEVDGFQDSSEADQNEIQDVSILDVSVEYAESQNVAENGESP